MTREVVKSPENHTIWRVDALTGLFQGNPHLYADYDIKVTDSVIPGKYQFEEKIHTAVNSEKYSLAGAW